MKTITGFQNMGTDVKLLSAACKLFSTSCNSSFSPPPISCAENKNIPGCYPCACGICIPFRLHFVLGFLFVPHRETRHFILPSLQAFTSAPHSFGSLLPFHFASSINSVSHYPSSFPTHFQRYVLFSAPCLPQWKNPFGFDKEWSLFPKGFKKQISKRQIQ